MQVVMPAFAAGHEGEEVSVISFDYGYLNALDDHETITLLCAVDRQTRCEPDASLAWRFQEKGGTAFATEQLVNFVKGLGYRRVALRCDQEEAALRLRTALRARMPEPRPGGRGT
eukprot:325824-Amphidinium_carterae.2